LAFFFSGNSALGVQNVVSTAHNLATLTNDTDEVCVFCHTSHTEPSGDMQLWNRKTDGMGYTMYSSSTLDMTTASNPQGISLLCLSCHDGVIAYDQLINLPGAGGYYPDASSASWDFPGGNTMTGVASLGRDLRGDHPISVTYDPTQDPAFTPAGSVTAAGLPLYGSGVDQVECGTCHDPHEATLRSFQRTGGLCTTCHIK
jgi:predicted CXXCH cytochrome family protein